MNIDQLRSLMASTVDDATFDSVVAIAAPKASRELWEGEVFIVDEQHGIEIHTDADSGQVSSVFMFLQPNSQDSPGFAPYGRELPFGISPESAREDVKVHVGRAPDHRAGSSDSWYEDNFRLVVSYYSGKVGSISAAKWIGDAPTG